MIILSHVRIPDILRQGRDFDVPLMVIISGISMMMSPQGGSYSLYVWKRIKRLAMPTWIFLTVYFILNRALGWTPSELNTKTVLCSYAFLQDHSIGYVWIIRVFLLVALLAPPIRYLAGKIKSTSAYLLALLVFWCVYETILWISQPYLDNSIGRMASMYIFYGISYGIIFALGLRYKELSSRQIILVSGIGLVTFILLMTVLYRIKGQLTPTVYYKYPPSTYYVSYALFVAGFLYLISGRITKVMEYLRPLDRFTMFVAKNSIWIYLWHIIAVQVTITIQTTGYDGYGHDAVLLLANNWILSYICIYAFGVLAAWTQVAMVTKLLIPALKSDKAKRNIRTVLTG